MCDCEELSASWNMTFELTDPPAGICAAGPELEIVNAVDVLAVSIVPEVEPDAPVYTMNAAIEAVATVRPTATEARNTFRRFDHGLRLLAG